MNNLEEAHNHCSHNKTTIESSKLCGCFCCLRTFDPATIKIKEWVDVDGMTALCPYCGIDSVLADSDAPVEDKEFLKAMYDRWFSDLHDEVLHE